MYTKGDFHIHTKYSDGQLTPKEVVNLAEKEFVDIIAVTDHNNTDGVDEAIEEGNKTGVRVIPGIELSTRFKNKRVHILGYFKDDSYKNEVFRKILYYVRAKKIVKIKEIFETSSDIKWQGEKLPIEIGIEILKFFGATVVLAHPILLSNDDFDEIAHMNFDGIEAKYFLNSKGDEERFINFANTNSLIYTAGSDFHGLVELYRIHGTIGCVNLNSYEIQRFLECIYK